MTATLACAGCENGLSNAWWNGFLDPSEVGNYRENVVSDIQRAISFRDTPLGIAGAEDPKPQDLVANVEEYQIGPGDTLQIRLLDFVQLGTETELALAVDELGYLDLPQIGNIRAEGRTARELRSDIIQKAKAQGIYNPDSEPAVTVVVANGLQRMYNLSGSVLYPGPYRIPKPDFRLREAINQGGGMDDTVKMVWVYRNSPREKRMIERPALPPAESGQTPAKGPEVPAPPVTPMLMSDLGASAGSPAATGPAQPAPAARPSGANLALPADELPKDLIEAVAPPTGATQPGQTAGQLPPAAPAPPTTGPSGQAPGTTGGLPSYKFVNDAFIEVPAGKSSVAPGPASQAPVTGPAATRPAGEPVDWEELANELEQRIIRIPADKLRNGDPTYNIVVVNDDWIRVDPGPVGLYYMAGHVARPGPYAFAGEQLTLTQAIASAGGLDQLAWPTRCEVRRRLDADREEITQWDMARILDGKDPDFYLKPNDVIRVGTHAIAPLLATIRNSFRFTYGFGFVYDRNFADIDSFNAQVNPKDRHRAERQQLFGNLFQ